MGFNQQVKVLFFSESGAIDVRTASWDDFASTIYSLIILDGMEWIGKGIFADFYELERVTIPSSVFSIGSNPF